MFARAPRSSPLFLPSARRISHNSRYKRFGDPLPSSSSLPSPRSGGASLPLPPALRTFQRRFNSLRQNPPYVLIAIGTGSALYYVTHLERVPFTGRIRFMDLDPASERAMGAESLQQVLREYRGRILPSRDGRVRQVKEIVRRIVSANQLETGEGDWDVYVVQDDANRNAFVLPGGHVFVFTGILPITMDENGLSAVLGHELAHQVARHSAERMSSLKVLFALSTGLALLGIDFGLSRVLLNLVMTLPNSRVAEREADKIGLLLSSRACYDPRAAQGLWKRMKAAEGPNSSEMDFLSTHPASGKRIELVTTWAGEMMREREERCGPIGEQMRGFREAGRRSWV